MSRRAIANQLYSQGVLLKHIAEHLGVSHQRVSQLITVPRRGRGNTGKQTTTQFRPILRCAEPDSSRASAPMRAAAVRLAIQ